uniref:Putative secreted protein n=1 Tax=Ixodes ricinus TaxID=34613 RepID=A0A131Y7L6_IXORI
MIRLTSSRTSASVLLFVLLVKQGACVQPECDPLEFYRIYSPVIFSLKFMVTGELNTPHILQQDCDDLKYVTQRVETLLQGCTADKNEELKKHIRGLQLTQESLCGGERQEDLNLWKDCFDAKVFAECKKSVEERLNKLEQDGALHAGDHICRIRSLSFQCALQAGAGCPEKAERARKAVENYINALMDPSICRRPSEYACEDDLFRKCYRRVADPGDWQLPMFPSGAEKIAEGCKVAKSVPTCTRNVQIERCPEEKKKYLYTLKDRFWSISDSLCNEQLPAGVEVWNKCLNQKALENCRSKIPEPNPNFDTEADRHADSCRVGGETLKCELAAGSDCPASASPAKEALYDLRGIELDLFRCPRPKIDGYGGSGLSTTPAILVTLSALCVALLPLKHTLLRDLN